MATETKFVKLEEIKIPFAPSSAGFMRNMRKIKSLVKNRYGRHWEIKELQRDEKKGQWKIIIGEKLKVRDYGALQRRSQWIRWNMIRVVQRKGGS